MRIAEISETSYNPISRKAEELKSINDSDEISSKWENESTISNTDISNFSQSLFLLNEVEVLKPPEVPNLRSLLTASVIGIGVGAAMMPIFNHEIKELDRYDINIHEYEAAFVISTVNTLILTSICNIVNFYKYLENSEHSSTAANALGITASVMPLALLWNIELNNREVAESQGFDEFIAWAAISSIPLAFCKTIETAKNISNFINSSDKLDSIGAKIFTYGITGLATVGRFIAYSHATSELIKNFGVEEEAAEALGYICGGFLGSLVQSTLEYSSIKGLFKKQTEPTTVKDIVINTALSAEGLWFSLPVVSAGMTATEDWNTLLKLIVFAPLLVSATVHESLSMQECFTKEQELIGLTHDELV